MFLNWICSIERLNILSSVKRSLVILAQDGGAERVLNDMGFLVISINHYTKYQFDSRTSEFFASNGDGIIISYARNMILAFSNIK